jgi:hypothetical protein
MADFVRSLLKNIDTVKRLKEYVFNGDIVEVMTDAELSAAREAILKATAAVDQRAQVWSGINHLEAAHHRLKPIYHGKSSFWFATNMYRRRMIYKDQCILCLMAICYRAVDELDLCRTALAESKRAMDTVGKHWGGGALQVLHPRALPEAGVALRNWFLGNSVPYDDGLDVTRFEALLL